MIEKEFDLVKLLEESAKKLEADSYKMAGRRDGYEDVVNFIKSNNLKITQFVDEAAENPGTEANN